MNKKLKTMDDLCNQPPGTFKKFIEDREAQMVATENERKARIRAARAKKEKQ